MLTISDVPNWLPTSKVKWGKSDLLNDHVVQFTTAVICLTSATSMPQMWQKTIIKLDTTELTIALHSNINSILRCGYKSRINYILFYMGKEQYKML